MTGRIDRLRRRGVCTVIAALWLVPAVPHGRAAQHGAASDVDRAVHLLGRATWGVRPADLDAALAMGLEAWLERQLHPSRIDDRALAARLEAFPAAHRSMRELYDDFSPRPAEVRAREAARAGSDAPAPPMTPEERRAMQARRPARLLNELVGARIVRAVSSERQLEDVMTDFWFNHFNVFFGKGQTRFFVADYERTAIRPHVFGRFEDMLLATAQHPAMLFYLDNWQSVHAGDTPQASGEALRRRLAALSEAEKDALVRNGRLTRDQIDRIERGDAAAIVERRPNRGLNENYARELLELHTLGVDGGYTQQDVIEVARVFTGWSFQPPAADGARMQPIAPGAAARAGRRAQLPNRALQPFVGPGDVPFVFRPERHDRDPKTVLGEQLPGGRGLDEGREVIRMLARHPSTARHLATKLVERFVSDTPPADLVDHLADVFLRTGGDLRAVTRALFTAEEFFREKVRGAKVKTPFALVTGALRVTHAGGQPGPRLMRLLRALGHLPYSEAAPTGYPAASDDWVNAGAMLNRIDFALDLAAGRLDGIRPDFAALPGADARRPPSAESILAAVLPGRDTGRLADRIRADLDAQPGATGRERLVRALGLALGSPEFQHH